MSQPPGENSRSGPGQRPVARSEAEVLAIARRLKRAGQPHEAYQLHLQLLAQRTTHWEPFHEAALFSLARGNQPMALKFFRMASNRETQGAEATLGLARLLLQLGQVDEALEAWSERIRRSRDLPVLVALARFAQDWDGPREPLAAFLESLPGQNDFNYPEFCRVAWQGALPSSTQVFPPEPLPTWAAHYHGMPAPQPPAVTFPALKVHMVGNAIVRPFSDLVIAGDTCIVPDHFDLEEHLLYDTFIGRTFPLVGGGHFALKRESLEDWLPAGIVLTSFAIGNWVHFLTEIAPLVAIAESIGVPTEVPLLVSRPEAPQVLEFLERIKAPDRPVALIECPTLVREATWFTPAATVPFEFLKARCGAPVRHSPQDNLFSPWALALLRQRAGIRPAADASDGRVKIFIERHSSRRRLLNQAEVIRHFTDAGYLVVRPETLSLGEQIELFSRASVIAGQSGAGLANMLFAPADARILVFSGCPMDPEPHRYFASLAGALGQELHYFAFGEPSPDVHIDFSIDLGVLDQHRGLL